jgi:hypothetical protein
MKLTIEKFTRATRTQRGAALVEFALIFPILIILIMGIIEFSVLLYDKAVITNASREAARFGVVFRTDRPAAGAGYEAAVAARTADIRLVVTTYCGNNLVTFGNEPEIEVELDEGPCENPGEDLIVDVSYQYEFLVFPNLANLFGGAVQNGVELNARTVMRCE